MILTGYHGRFNQTERDQWINRVLRPACAEHGVGLLLGAGSYRDARGRTVRRPRIQVTVIDRHGRILGWHDKTIPTWGDLTWASRGELAHLRAFSSEGLTFGATICNDFWATPGYTRLPDINLPVLLARKGVRVIFHSIQSGGGKAYLDFHTRRMEERAIRAGVWVVSANAVSGRVPSNAPAGIVDPRGEWRVQAPLVGEQLVVGTITLGASRGRM
jgi:predicted amidohydrolase